MSIQRTLPDLDRPTTEHGNPIPAHIDNTANTPNHHGRCLTCGRSITISPSGVELGHETRTDRGECQWQRNRVGHGGQR